MLHDDGLDHLIDDDEIAVFEVGDIERCCGGAVFLRLALETDETETGCFEALIDLSQKKTVLVDVSGGISRVELCQGFSEKLLKSPSLDR